MEKKLKSTKILSKKGIKHFLNTRSRVTILDETGSTNDYLKSRRHIKAGDAVIAKTQCGGKGRLGKSFVSPEGGLYISIAVGFREPDILRITPAAAVLTRRAILTAFGIETDIKWVNDLYYRGKKICGILTETAGNVAVVGIGVNLTLSGVIDSAGNAGALFSVDENVSADRLAAEIINGLCAFDFGSDFAGEYRAHCFLIGKTVTLVNSDGTERRADVLDVNSDFSLKVRADGNETDLFTGEVSIKL